MEVPRYSQSLHNILLPSSLQGEIDTEKMDSAQTEFDKLNQNMRRELEHFDTVMRGEFGETFDKYHKQYRAALSSTSDTQNIYCNVILLLILLSILFCIIILNISKISFDFRVSHDSIELYEILQNKAIHIFSIEKCFFQKSP